VPVDVRMCVFDISVCVFGISVCEGGQLCEKVCVCDCKCMRSCLASVCVKVGL